MSEPRPVTSPSGPAANDASRERGAEPPGPASAAASGRALRCGLAAIAAFAVCYLLPAALQLPVPAYDPVHRTVAFLRAPAGLEMRYFGDLLYASVGGLAAAAVSYRRRSRAPIAVATGAALSLVALDVAFYLSRLLARV